MAHLEEALDILQHEDTTVREVVLLWHLGAGSPNVFLDKVSLAALLVSVFNTKVVPQSGHHSLAAGAGERVEDQDARPGNKKES